MPPAGGSVAHAYRSCSLAAGLGRNARSDSSHTVR